MAQDRTYSFGYWLRRRRKALDLTQEALASRVGCSSFSIRKIEADERRPSRRLADRLAATLAIPENERREFLDAARAVRAADRLRLDAAPVDGGTPTDAPAQASDASIDAATTASVDTLPFIGRSHEYAHITELVERLAEGVGHIVLIEGEPGIGKSRLMREVARHAITHGVSTLAANCYEIERAIPYQPVIELITRALERVSSSGLHSLAPVSLAELAALAPEVEERYSELPRLSTDFPEARQARLPRAVAQLLEASRDGRPLILMVDDIQWADDASAQVLHFLARQAAQRPILAIYAYRDEEIDSDERLSRLVGSLRREAHAHHVPLSRLGPADTAKLVATAAVPSAEAGGLAERLHRETEGNPFFLVSILHSLSEGETRLEDRAAVTTGLLPDALRAAVRTRLAYVPSAFRPVLEAAAVLGRRFDFDILLDVTRESENQLLHAVESLVKRRLLWEEPEGGVYDFSHDKVREVVYRDIGGARRRLLHRSIAETLERRAEGDAPERDAQLAEHYERAHVWSKALRYLLLAGERSQALFAMRDALHWLDRAVALCEAHPEAADPDELLAIYERRGIARAQAGQTEGAVSDIRRALDAARARGERGRTREALVRLGMAYRRADAYDQASACLTEALAEARAMNDERHAADTLYHLGTVAWSTGMNHQALRFHQESVEICERMRFSDLVSVQAYHGRGEAYYANAEPVPAIECFTRSLELARAIGDKGYESENLMMIGHACLGTKGLGDYPRAKVNLEAALEIARSADLQWHIGPTLLGLDHARACTGEYGEAWSGMRETLRWLESLNQVRYQMIAHDFIGHLLLDLRLDDLALEYLDRGLKVARDAGIAFWQAAIDAHVAVARSRLHKDAAAPALSATLEQTRRNSEHYLMVRCLDGLAEIALTAGSASGCLKYANELLAIAERNGLRELEAAARRWRGEAFFTERAYTESLSELSRAATLARSVGRVRIQMDAEATIAKLLEQLDNAEDAQRYDASARAIASVIDVSLRSSDLRTGFRPPHRN